MRFLPPPQHKWGKQESKDSDLLFVLFCHCGERWNVMCNQWSSPGSQTVDVCTSTFRLLSHIHIHWTGDQNTQIQKPGQTNPHYLDGKIPESEKWYFKAGPVSLTIRSNEPKCSVSHWYPPWWWVVLSAMRMMKCFRMKCVTNRLQSPIQSTRKMLVTQEFREMVTRDFVCVWALPLRLWGWFWSSSPWRWEEVSTRERRAVGDGG